MVNNFVSSAELVGQSQVVAFSQENPDRINRMYQDGQDKAKYYNQMYTFIFKTFLA